MRSWCQAVKRIWRRGYRFEATFLVITFPVSIPLWALLDALEVAQ